MTNPIEELRIPRKKKKQIKKLKTNVFKVKCWRDKVTKRVFFDVFFKVNKYGL